MEFKIVRTTLLILIVFFFQNCTAQEGNPGKALIIMGASCSGKSTLARKLLERFDKNWRLVELDTIEESLKCKESACTDDVLIETLVHASNEVVQNGENVLIDTNVYNGKLHHIRSHSQKFILIHCPLKVLLERNKRRDTVLQRDPQRSTRATQYVVETFHRFNKNIACDLRIDSSVTGLADSCQQVIELWDNS